MRAFAFGRSTLFARKARASGQAELFESFAYAEALDDLFSDGEISDSDADVRAAIASEAGAAPRHTTCSSSKRVTWGPWPERSAWAISRRKAWAATVGAGIFHPALDICEGIFTRDTQEVACAPSAALSPLDPVASMEQLERQTTPGADIGHIGRRPRAPNLRRLCRWPFTSSLAATE